MNISDTPLHVITSSFSAGAYLMVIAALLVPIISYLTQVLNIKLMPQATASGNDQSDAMAQQMKMMNRMMPLFSLVMFLPFRSVSVSTGLPVLLSVLYSSIS